VTPAVPATFAVAVAVCASIVATVVAMIAFITAVSAGIGMGRGRDGERRCKGCDGRRRNQKSFHRVLLRGSPVPSTPEPSGLIPDL
jgi:hypothetical protein